jgi:hypothetical protein
MTVLMASACLCFGGGGNETKPGEGKPGEGAVVTTTIGSGGIAERLVDLALAASSGQSYRCTYTTEGYKVESWIKGEQSSSELKTPEGNVMRTISNGTWAYTWVDGQTQGMKVKISDVSPDNPGEMQGLEYAETSYAVETAMDVDCRLTKAPEGVFTPPSGISFQDVGELMKQMQAQLNTSGSPGVDDSCVYCDMMPDEEARRQCLENC